MSALKVRPVMIADRVEVVDVVVARDGRVWRKLRKCRRGMTWTTLRLSPRCWQGVPHLEAVRGWVIVFGDCCCAVLRHSLRHVFLAAAAAVPVRHIRRHVETLERKLDSCRQLVARRSRRTALSKTFEVDDQNVRRRPKDHLSDDFLFPVAGRAEPGLALPEFFSSGVKAEAFLKCHARRLFRRFCDLQRRTSIIISLKVEL